MNKHAIHSGTFHAAKVQAARLNFERCRTTDPSLQQALTAQLRETKHQLIQLARNNQKISHHLC